MKKIILLLYVCIPFIVFGQYLDKIEPNHLMAVDCIIRLEQHILKNSLTELRNKLKSSDDDFDDNVLEQLNSLEKQISQLKNKYNEQ